MKNEGPDAALGVELEVDYGGSNSTFDVLGGTSVADVQSGKRGGSICSGEGVDRRCPIGRLDPGQSYRVIVQGPVDADGRPPQLGPQLRRGSPSSSAPRRPT